MFARGQAALILVLAVLAPARLAAEVARQAPTPRTDRHGDPLPPGAVVRLGTTRLRHQSYILRMAFSPDGKVLASAGEWETTYARLWDTATGKEVGRIAGALRNHPLDVVKFSSTGRLLAGVSPYEREDILLWDAATGKLLHRLATPRGRRENLSFLDGDKTLVAVDREGTVRWWDVATGKMVREWDAMQGVAKPDAPGTWKFHRTYCATLTRDGRILAAFVEWEGSKTDKDENAYRRRLIVWDLDRHKQRWHLERGKEDSFVFDLSADGKVAAVGMGKADLSIRDGVTGRELHRIKDPAKGGPNRWESLALTADGKMLAALGEGATVVRVWDTGSGKVLHQLCRNVAAIPQRFRSSSGRPVIFSPDGKTLAFPLEDTLALWDVASWTERPRREGHREPVWFLSFSADGKMLVSGGEGAWPHGSYPYTAVHWSTATWRETARFERSDEWLDSQTLYVSRDHRRGIVNTDDGDLFVTERPGGKKLCRLAARSKVFLQASAESGSFFSPSSKLVVQAIPTDKSAPDFDWDLMDAASGKRRGTLPETARRVQLAISPDDKTVAWIDKEGVIRVVAVDGGKELRRLGTPLQFGINSSMRPALAFSPGGRHLASWEWDTDDIIIWDWRTGKQHRRLPGRRSDSFYEIALAFSPNGRCLAVGGMAGEHDVEVWEVETGQLRRRFSGHLGVVLALAFSPDSRLLASGSADTTVLVWDLYGLPPRDKPTREQVKLLWADLAHSDARRRCPHGLSSGAATNRVLFIAASSAGVRRRPEESPAHARRLEQR